MKKFIFLILTVLFSASVFAFDVVPPDKPVLLTHVLDLGETSDLVIDTVSVIAYILNESTNGEMRIENRLALNRPAEGFNLLVPAIDQFAVVQNQNFDRMHQS